MHPYMERLREDLDKKPPCYGYADADSLLDMLYMWYAEWNPINSEQIRKDFLALESYLAGCTDQKTDDALDIVTRLCGDHQRLAFLEGLRVGVRLACEL